MPSELEGVNWRAALFGGWFALAYSMWRWLLVFVGFELAGDLLFIWANRLHPLAPGAWGAAVLAGSSLDVALRTVFALRANSELWQAGAYRPMSKSRERLWVIGGVLLAAFPAVQGVRVVAVKWPARLVPALVGVFVYVALFAALAVYDRRRLAAGRASG